ncbi:MAG: hypothetical protein E2599_13040 [Klebsiella sp.]|nr:hypothetical protein [Klebsiella sp.]
MKPGRRAGQDVHNASQISFCRVETQRHIDFLNLPPNASHFAGVMPVFYCQQFILFINELGLFIYQAGRCCRTDVHFCVANRNTK